MLKDEVALSITDQTWQSQWHDLRHARESRDLLLLSRALPLPRLKQYGPTGSSKPVTLPRLANCPRSQSPVAAAVVDTLRP